MSDPWIFDGRRLIPHTPEDEDGLDPRARVAEMEAIRRCRRDLTRPPPTGVPSWPPDVSEPIDRAPLLIVAVGVVIAAVWAIGIAVNLL